MKDRMQRCVVLPFSFGCSKQSSVAVADSTHQHKKPNQLIKSTLLLLTPHLVLSFFSFPFNSLSDFFFVYESEDNGFLVQKEDTKMDNNSANISDKIIRSFKSFSHFFICYGDEEREEREAEMEIGFPTDVKHLSHIGVDGTMTTFNVSSSSFPFAGLHLTAV
uniref:CRIB domain-containing protein n=1 Tax=Brassica campestris TaxID=3711 RepID=A0A3P5YLR0_BRACM|nr:unnamed protein product [Brassica rapa]